MPACLPLADGVNPRVLCEGAACLLWCRLPEGGRCLRPKGQFAPWISSDDDGWPSSNLCQSSASPECLRYGMVIALDDVLCLDSASNNGGQLTRVAPEALAAAVRLDDRQAQNRKPKDAADKLGRAANEPGRG